MAKQDKSTDSVYRVTEVIGTSTISWEDAAKTAVETASGTLRDLRIAEVVKMDVKIEDGKFWSTAPAYNSPSSTEAEGFARRSRLHRIELSAFRMLTRSTWGRFIPSP